ncbi:sialidase-4 [Pelodiscus sinensis]|uniref:sialidase-4 n=1 Tax=Pelodiscus sinensis TaxID=13735 RepID=UPI003F6B006F
MGSRHFPARTVLFEREPSGVTYRVPWEAMRALPTAALKHHRSMNPCPVYDEFTGIVFLFFIAVLGVTPEAYQIVTGRNAARLCYVASADQGLTWSQATDLTQQVVGQAIADWATFALGPGHGIQLKSGRLLVPAYAYHIDCKECFGKLCQTTPHAFAFYSDDHGQSWRFGEPVPSLPTVECQLVSVDEEDGGNILYCNARSPLGCRVQALSADDGAVFHPGQLVQRLVEPHHGCHGSIIGFPAPLFYAPSSPPAQPSARWAPNGPDCPLLCRQTTRQRCLPLCAMALGNPAAVSLGSPQRGRQQPADADVPCPSSSHHETPGSRAAVAPGGGQGQPEPGAVAKSTSLFQPPTWVLYSHPTSASARVNLGVYLSTFPRDADSWTEPWVIYEGPSAYSDLACVELPPWEFPATGIPPTAFACLYENGTRSPYEQISFSMFTLYEVLQNIPLRAAAPALPRRAATSKGGRGCIPS